VQTMCKECESPSSLKHHLTATRWLRKMRGNAQSHLIEASDRRSYVVKFQDNPQHKRVLVNELVASLLLGCLDIAAPPAATIWIDDKFLHDNPEVAMTIDGQSIPYRNGLQFASLYAGDPSGSPVYDFLPDTLLHEVINLEDFLGAFVFDKWVANADPRQAVFYRTGGANRRRFAAAMIDEGLAFGGGEWRFRDCPAMGLYHRSLVYQNVSGIESFEPWLDRVANFSRAAIEAAFAQVPEEWLECGERQRLDVLADQLYRRRGRVADLIEETIAVKAAQFPGWAVPEKSPTMGPLVAMPALRSA
jgi:hypothetical protein